MYPIITASDSVNKTTLWKALHSKGIPDNLLHMITALHESTVAFTKTSP